MKIAFVVAVCERDLGFAPTFVESFTRSLQGVLEPRFFWATDDGEKLDGLEGEVIGATNWKAGGFKRASSVAKCLLSAAEITGAEFVAKMDVDVIHNGSRWLQPLLQEGAANAPRTRGKLAAFGCQHSLDSGALYGMAYAIQRDLLAKIPAALEALLEKKAHRLLRAEDLAIGHAARNLAPNRFHVWPIREADNLPRLFCAFSDKAEAEEFKPFDFIHCGVSPKNQRVKDARNAALLWDYLRENSTPNRWDFSQKFSAEPWI